MADAFEITWKELALQFFGCAFLVALFGVYWFGV
jgi:hypothetical protein